MKRLEGVSLYKKDWVKLKYTLKGQWGKGIYRLKFGTRDDIRSDIHSGFYSQFFCSVYILIRILHNDPNPPNLSFKNESQ